jgi:cupin fold WbuC family metalloprotein
MNAELPLTRINDEVFVASGEIVRLDARAIEFIREFALTNKRGRARICAHRHATDMLHEMLIATRADSYVRPHRHHNKVESFHLIDGTADIVIFEDDGEIADVISLGPGKNFYYRLELPKYHTLLINSPLLVVHEITNGPFDITQSDFASFSPAEGEPDAIGFTAGLRRRVTAWLAAQASEPIPH